MVEFAVLVDEYDKELGVVPKETLHTNNTPLHRAFSLFIFNLKGKIFVQQRNKNKKTWGGFWSKSCGGHPAPEESREEAAKRRSFQEFGVDVNDIQKIADYRYRLKYNGIVENEICPIFVGFMRDEAVNPNPKEIEAFKWMEWLAYRKDMEQNPSLYAPWAQEQIKILNNSPSFFAWLKNHNLN